MINLLKEGNAFNTNIQQYLLDSIEDIPSIPWSAPVGSTAIILNETEFLTKMKKRQNVWADIDSGVEIPVEPPKPIEPEVPDYGPVVATFDLSEPQDKSVVMNVYQPKGQKQQLVISGKGKIADYSGGEFMDSKYNYANPDDPINSIVPSDLIIEDGITEIGEMAFSAFYGVETIKLPDTITTIGDLAFEAIPLKSIYIPANLVNLSPSALLCTGILDLNIPGHLNRILEITVDENNPVYDSRDNCNALIDSKTNSLLIGTEKTTIPDTVTSIGEGAFYSCTLTNMTMPDNITSIGEGAFESCGNLTSIELPNSITTIEERTFFDCTSLTEITIPKGVTSIGYRGFGYCTNLANVIIPEGVTSIGSEAFADTGLTEVSVPKGCTYTHGSEFGNSFPEGCVVTERQ